MSDVLTPYAHLAPTLKKNLDLVDCPASFYSPLNIIGRLALGKWTLEQREGFWAFVGDGVVRLVPPPTKAEYYAAILAWAAKKTQVTMVPEYMANVMRGAPARVIKVLKVQTEYIMDPAKLEALSGGSLAVLRNDRNRALKVSVPQVLDVTLWQDQLLALNRLWYTEAKDRLWRPSEKAHIDWLIQNWETVLALEPTATCVGVRDLETGELLSFEMGSALTETYVSSFTQRSIRDRLTGAYSGVNVLASLELSRAFPGKPLNDGPAGTSFLAHRKAKMAMGTLDLFSVEAR